MVVASWYTVMGDAFQALGIPLIRGRYLGSADSASAPLNAVVSRSFAEHYWHGQNPIGKHLRLGSPEMALPWLTVAGEVADVKEGAGDSPNVEQFYQPLEQFGPSLGPAAGEADRYGSSMTLVLRSTASPGAMETVIRQSVHRIDPQLALSQLNTMEQAFRATEDPRRFNVLLFASFAGATLLLGTLGVYGLVAFSATQRTREIAIRIALGGEPANMVRLFVAMSLRLAAAGCAIGLLGSLAVSRLLASLLFQVSPLDPVTLCGSVTAVAAMVLGASFLPVRRVVRIEPMLALRAE